MPALERRISLRGPRFWIEDGKLMFCNQIDGSTRDGPRDATPADKASFPDAYAKGPAGDDAGLGSMLSVSNPETMPAEPPRPFAERRERAGQR